MSNYDPNKSYTWGPDTKFVLSGQEFSLLLHAVRGVLSTKEASNVVLIYEMNKKIEEIMATAVAEGKVVEVQPEGPQVDGPHLTKEIVNLNDSPKRKLSKAK